MYNVIVHIHCTFHVKIHHYWSFIFVTWFHDGMRELTISGGVLTSELTARAGGWPIAGRGWARWWPLMGCYQVTKSTPGLAADLGMFDQEDQLPIKELICRLFENLGQYSKILSIKLLIKTKLCKVQYLVYIFFSSTFMIPHPTFLFWASGLSGAFELLM